MLTNSLRRATSAQRCRRPYRPAISLVRLICWTIEAADQLEAAVKLYRKTTRSRRQSSLRQLSIGLNNSRFSPALAVQER